MTKVFGRTSQSNPSYMGALERRAVNYVEARVAEKTPVTIFEIGPGNGNLAVKMANVGASIVVCDLKDSLDVTAKELCQSGKIVQHVKPIQNLLWDEIPDVVNGLVSLRSLHWLRRKDAYQALSKVANRMPLDAPLLVSLAGTDCPYQHQGYPTHEPIARRFFPSAKLHGGFGRNCTLYKPGEIMDLVQDSGFKVLSINPTDWGLWNVHAVRSEVFGSRISFDLQS